MSFHVDFKLFDVAAFSKSQTLFKITRLIDVYIFQFIVLQVLI